MEKASEVFNTLISNKSNGKAIIAKVLLEYFDIKLSYGDSFLHMFVSMNFGRMVKTILELIRRAETPDILNYVNDKGETALHSSIVFYRPEIMALLLSAGSDPNLYNDEGDTPLHLAVREDNSECMVQLLDKSNYKTKQALPLDVNIFNNAGWTALHLAARCRSLASVSRLIRAGADCNVRGKSNGQTVLHLAVSSASNIMVNYILEHTKINVNCRAFNGTTALHLCCSLDDPKAHEICKSLLQHGADPKIKYNSVTALELAKNNINIEVLNVMKDHLSKQPDVKESNTPNLPLDREVKEEPHDFVDGFLDSKTVETVTNLLNESGMWKIIAVELGLSGFISLCMESDNPSRMLLHYIEFEEKISLKYLHELLLKLGEIEAAVAIKNAIGDK